MEAFTKDSSDIVTKTADALTATEDRAIVKDILKYGNTPVIYGPTKGMMKPPSTPGLGYMISNAMSEKEVTNLITNGIKGYKNASAKTIRTWEKLAQQRISQLAK
jgi:hypothetical protein